MNSLAISTLALGLLAGCALGIAGGIQTERELRSELAACGSRVLACDDLWEDVLAAPACRAAVGVK